MKLSLQDLNPDSYPPTPHKHLYFWSNLRIKDVWWSNKMSSTFIKWR